MEATGEEKVTIYGSQSTLHPDLAGGFPLRQDGERRTVVRSSRAGSQGTRPAGTVVRQYWTTARTRPPTHLPVSGWRHWRLTYDRVVVVVLCVCTGGQRGEIISIRNMYTTVWQGILKNNIMIRLSFLPKLVILIYIRKSYREFFLILVLLTPIIAVIPTDNQCILIGMQSRFVCF